MGMRLKKCCGNCLVVSVYEQEDMHCKHCNYNILQSSDVFEDAYGMQQKNQRRLEALETVQSQLINAIEKFEVDWNETWNTEGDSILQFEIPENFNILDHLL